MKLLGAVFLSFVVVPAMGKTAMQTNSEISRVYVDDTGAVHIAYSSGKGQTIPKQDFSADQKQTSASQIQISADKHSAGWVLEYSGIGASYSQGIVLVIFRSGKVIQDFLEAGGYIFSNWHFVEGAQQVGFCQVLMHGAGPNPHCELHSLPEGRLLKQWSADESKNDEEPPAWVKPFL
jgi:hypothetical protein